MYEGRRVGVYGPRSEIRARGEAKKKENAFGTIQ
jgi:hypothetical protein